MLGKGDIMRIVKYGIYSLLTLVVLLIIGIGSIVLFIDPNHFKGQIETLAKEKAGIALSISGDLSWTFYPWLGVTFEETAIAPVSAPEEILAKVNNVAISLKVMPLIQGDLEMSRIKVDGLTLNVIRDQAGKSNWDFLGKHESEERGKNNAVTADESSTKAKQVKAKAARSLNISGIDIAGSTIIYHDQAQGLQLNADNISLSADEIRQNGPHISLGELKIKEGDITFFDYTSGKAVAFEAIKLSLERLIAEILSDENDESGIKFSLDRVALGNSKITYSERDSGLNLWLQPNAFETGNLYINTLPQKNELPWQVEGIHLKDATLFYRADGADSYLKAEGLTLTSSKLDSGNKSDLALSGHLTKEHVIDLSFDGKTALVYDLENNLYQLNHLALTAVIDSVEGEKRGITLNAGGELTLDLMKERIYWKAPNLKLNQLKLPHDIALQGFNPETLTLATTLDLKNLNLRTFLTDLGIALPKMQSSKALTNLSLSGDLKAGMNRVELTNLAMNLDGTALRGSVLANDLSKKSYTVRLSGDRLNLNDYLPPKASASKGASASNQGKSAQNTSPFEALKGMTINADFALNQLIYDAYTINHLDLGLSINDRLISLHRGRGEIFGGTVGITGKIDGRSALPSIEITPDIQNLVLGEAFNAFELNIPLTGRLQLSGSLRTKGLDKAPIFANLSGNLRANVLNGVLEGVNYEKEICQGLAMLNKERLTTSFNRASTPFNALRASLTIKNGVLNNQDLAVEIPGIDAKGAGSVNLNNQTLDYRIGLTLKGDQRENRDPACRVNKYIANTPIPLRCQGSFVNAGKNLCGLDNDAIGKMIAEMAGKAVEKKIEETVKETIKPEIDRVLKEELGDQLEDVKNLFDGLFK